MYQRIFCVFLALSLCLGSGRSLQAVDTLWNFDGDLATASGPSTLTYRGNTQSVTQFGTPAALGLAPLYGTTGAEQVMAFPAATPSQGYTVAHNGSPLVEQYTMIWDVLYPESSDIQWRPLLQTGEANNSDGDFFVNAVPYGGVGIGGQYHGAIVPGEWNRVAVTRDAAGKWTKYINGGFVGEQDASSSRFALDPTFHLFADESNETAPGYVSSFRYLDRTMSQPKSSSWEACMPLEPRLRAACLMIPALSSRVPSRSRSWATRRTTVSSIPEIYAQQTQWLVDNKANHNIQFAMHVGDVVNFENTTQWNNAAAAMSTLDGQLNYAVVPGNHDYANNRNASQFNQANRFGPGSAYAGQSTLAGYYPAEPNSRMNTWHTFEANGEKMLVMALEFGPRDEVVSWAESVVDAHPDHRAILLTHAYMYDGGTWFDAVRGPQRPAGPHLR